MINELEKKFFTKEEVEKLMKNNSEVMNILKKEGKDEFLYVRVEFLSELVKDFINAKRIEEDNVIYTTAQQMINASNQNLWAYGILDLCGTGYISNHLEDISKTVQLLWGTEIINPSEKNAQKFIRKSLDLGREAIKARDFKDEQISYLLCNYIKNALIKGGGIEENRKNWYRNIELHPAILERFLNNMNKEKSLEETLDFFDKHLVEGQFLHPFKCAWITAIQEPYEVKYEILKGIHDELKFDIWRYNPKNGDEKKKADKLIRINRTLANFNLHATWEMYNWINNPNLGRSSRFLTDRIKEAYKEVQILIGLKGNAFVKFLEENGFEDGVRDRYVWEYNQETGQTKKEYSYTKSKSDFKNLVDQTKNKLNGALEILGLRDLPEDKKVARSAYYRICKLWHPDLCNLPDAEENTKKANLAWEIISKYYN